jgi:hypothetical protein
LLALTCVAGEVELLQPGGPRERPRHRPVERVVREAEDDELVAPGDRF